MMMRMIARLLVAVALLMGSGAASMAETMPQGSFITLCYHNVEDVEPDQTYDGVTTAKLIEQLGWLQSQGYQAVSIDDILAAREGRKPLPEKAMLLTFDDGYVSFYTRVYPVLRSFNFPAVLAVVNEWMPVTSSWDAKTKKTVKVKSAKADTAREMSINTGDKVSYGDTSLPRSAFLTWEMIRDMQKSGLVEIASHSAALHKGILANPQGNTEPAALTSKYDAASGTYEMAEQYVRRLQADAAASVATIKKFTGKAPRVIVWPYGAYNEVGVLIQGRNGMPISLSLDDGYAKVSNLRNVPRMLVKDDPDIGDFAVQVRRFDKTAPMRAVQVDLDYVYDPNPEQVARNIDTLISRIYNMKIGVVYLQAFSDPTASGFAKEVYFPNRFLPMRADLFNRVAWQLKTRAMVDVYGWLPVLSYDFNDVQKVEAWDPKTGSTGVVAKGYQRLSPFDPEARRRIIGLYEDLSRHGPVDGVLFHDDAMLSDFEDASPAALEAYKAAGFPGSIAEIRANADTWNRWTSFKTETMISFTQELASHVKAFRAPIKTVRNIYANLLLHPESESWFAQSYSRFLQAYDYTAVEAMPNMENVPESEHSDWLDKLIDAAAKQPKGLKRTVFELQSVDWRIKDSSRAIPADKLAAQMNHLSRRGALNFGYYPDDFIANVPDTNVLHKAFSLQAYPYMP